MSRIVGSGQWRTGGEKWTNAPDHKPKIGLFRRQAERHGLQTDTWGQEPQREKIPPKKFFDSAMQPRGRRGG